MRNIKVFKFAISVQNLRNFLSKFLKFKLNYGLPINLKKPLD